MAPTKLFNSKGNPMVKVITNADRTGYVELTRKYTMENQARPYRACMGIDYNNSNSGRDSSDYSSCMR